MSTVYYKKMNDKRLQILANNIRAERIRKRLSQEELAESININKNSLLKIENARQKPSVFIVLDIANALEIPIEDLLKNIPKQSM